MSWLKSLFCIILLLLAVLLEGCSSAPSSEKDGSEKDRKENAIPFTVVYKEASLLHIPLYAAISQGFFQEEGLTVKLQQCSNNQENIEGLLKNNYDLMITGPETGLYLYQQGYKNEIVYLGQSASINGYFLLARDCEKPFSFSNVKGKVIIGAENGEYQELILENILRANNIRPLLDVHITNNLPLLLRAGIFASGTGHFILTTEPTATALEKEGCGHVVTYLCDHSNARISSAIMANKSSIISDKKERFQKFFNALQQGLIWVNSQSPVEITAMSKDYFPDLEEKTLLRGICRYKNLGCWPKTPLLSEKELLKIQELMLDAKELNSAIPLSQLSDHSFAQNAIEKHTVNN